LDVNFAVGTVVLGSVELGNDDVGSVQSFLQLLLLWLGRLAVSTPRSVEKYEDILSFYN
jgi:hypothetical protein